MALLLVATIGGFAYSAWNSIFRYAAYGDVATSISNAPAPWAGTVQAVYVREGDWVEQGQPVAWMVSRNLQRRLNQLEGERRLARARLIADTAEYWARAADHHENQVKQESEYLQMLGEVTEMEARIDYLSERESRLAQLWKQRAISEEELNFVRQELTSLRSKVQKWRASLKRIGSLADSIMPMETMQHLEPQRVVLENIAKEIQRIQQQQQLGEIVAPVSGRVSRRRHFVGDYAAEGETLVEIIPDGATEVVIYWPQRTKHPEVGEAIQAQLAPFTARHWFVVKKVGAEHRAAPAHLETRYRAAELLLPIYMKPASDIQLVPGQEVRVPRAWLPWRGEAK